MWVRQSSLLILFLLSAGCSNTRIIRSWKAENIPEKKYNRILVVGLFRNEDSLLGDKIETHFVYELEEKGLSAVPWTKQYARKSFAMVKQDSILTDLNDVKADAILTIVLLDKKKEYNYVTRKVLESPDVFFDRRFWGYYNSTYDRIYVPAYYEETTRYFWEGNFYDMGTKKLIYSSQSESFNQGSVENLVSEYGELMVRDLLKKGIIFQTSLK